MLLLSMSDPHTPLWQLALSLLIAGGCDTPVNDRHRWRSGDADTDGSACEHT
jgi:hypothetical protein